MKKSDLKSGMVVELRNGNRGIIMDIFNYKEINGAQFPTDSRFIMFYYDGSCLDFYTEDLRYYEEAFDYGPYVHALDIIKVYKIKNCGYGVGKMFGDQKLLKDENLIRIY